MDATGIQLRGNMTICIILIITQRIMTADMHKMKGAGNMTKHEYISDVTGEIVTGILSVIKTIVSEKLYWGFWNLKWKKFV